MMAKLSANRRRQNHIFMITRIYERRVRAVQILVLEFFAPQVYTTDCEHFAPPW